MSNPDCMMTKLVGPFWWAARSRFIFPGLYFCTHRTGNKRILPLPAVKESMVLIEFPEQTVVIAKDPPQYRPLPAHRFGDAEGRIACCWKITFSARVKVLFTGKIWQQILTFNQPLQPQLLTVEKPEMKEAR